MNSDIVTLMHPHLCLTSTIRAGSHRTTEVVVFHIRSSGHWLALLPCFLCQFICFFAVAVECGGGLALLFTVFILWGSLHMAVLFLVGNFRCRRKTVPGAITWIIL